MVTRRTHKIRKPGSRRKMQADRNRAVSWRYRKSRNRGRNDGSWQVTASAQD